MTEYLTNRELAPGEPISLACCTTWTLSAAARRSSTRTGKPAICWFRDIPASKRLTAAPDVAFVPALSR